MNRRERRAAAAKSKRDTSASPAADMAVVINAVVARKNISMRRYAASARLRETPKILSSCI